MIPQLREMERRFPDDLVAVGVHSGKFIAERKTPNIRSACRRLGVEHPVVNDRQFRIWRSYATRAWPTLTLIDPAGHVVFSRAGELTAEALAPLVESVIADAEAEGSLERGPFQLATPESEDPGDVLRFPGKVLASGGRLFISDSGHHRVLEVELDAERISGRITREFGTGSPGFADGDAGEARFNEPQGLALREGRLLVADRNNHSVRAVDLESGAVTTVAGTGELARSRSGPGLRSPWDLLWLDGTLYIAMAGSHQIWALEPGAEKPRPHAGSGVEDIHDAALADAALAQPSGLTADGAGRIYFADSESSGVRWAETDTGGRVGTLVGTGLFDFGDRDGAGDEVRLQHPMDVAWHAGKLIVADTYNHKLKRLDPTTRECRTWLGDGEPGDSDGNEPRFHEPGGLSLDGGRLYVADTNSHAIRVVELEEGVVRTLSLEMDNS